MDSGSFKAEAGGGRHPAESRRRARDCRDGLPLDSDLIQACQFECALDRGIERLERAGGGGAASCAQK